MLDDLFLVLADCWWVLLILFIDLAFRILIFPSTVSPPSLWVFWHLSSLSCLAASFHPLLWAVTFFLHPPCPPAAWPSPVCLPCLLYLVVAHWKSSVLAVDAVKSPSVHRRPVHLPRSDDVFPATLFLIPPCTLSLFSDCWSSRPIVPYISRATLFRSRASRLPLRTTFRLTSMPLSFFPMLIL